MNSTGDADAEDVEPSPGLKEFREWEEHLRSLVKNPLYLGGLGKDIAIAALYIGYLLKQGGRQHIADEPVEVEPQEDRGAGTQHGGEARQPQPAEVEPEENRATAPEMGGEARQAEPVEAEQRPWRQCAKCGTWIPPHKLVDGAHEHVCIACRRGKA